MTARKQIVQAWLLVNKSKEDPDAANEMYTVRFSDGTGNAFPVPNPGDVNGWQRLTNGAFKPFSVSGLPFENEPSLWLNDHDYFNINEVSIEGLPKFEEDDVIY